MNLGVVYIWSALAIAACAVALSAVAVLASALMRRRPLRWSTPLLGALAVGIPLTGIGLLFCHEPLFRFWHRRQNEAVPTAGCLSYEPTFWRLHASYRISPKAFDAWVASHPWGLVPCEPDGIFEFHDGPHFGLTSCEAAYESPRGPKGNNLRVYYHQGIAYLSYSAM
jgi:hypothetical protein